mmetsp:Transcript_415/g.617  ORF Transcript_415/g.617 Transcript_415/m.617 type:complete len:137 (-) Transcript_415:276-686(-)|eukprot:CAMPEP_0113938974 /NCGR_PEP_ID=MMETSP1339-20121228/5376_1 /TAXON_ID=94617 /ORGANISM="Fibrocapsa japonica" /LENGTH=136 /DNA_ID=CAMNT_0000942327 /DNA_START=23 /DNA_END=433 /DNA_ORIENTATION=+ /assembly_acc=CAM_ASM_000762
MATGEVMNWDEAMEQCGGEMDFLQELLQDFSAGLTVWIPNIKSQLEILKNNSDNRGQVVGAAAKIKTDAHQMKGAAANLMCSGIRDAAQFLENRGHQGSEGELQGDELVDAINECILTLERQIALFSEFCEEKGLV